MVIRSGSRSLSSAAASTSRSWRFCGAAKRVATTISSPGPALGPCQPAGTRPTLTPMSATKLVARREPEPGLGGPGLDQRARALREVVDRVDRAEDAGVLARRRAGPAARAHRASRAPPCASRSPCRDRRRAPRARRRGTPSRRRHRRGRPCRAPVEDAPRRAPGASRGRRAPPRAFRRGRAGGPSAARAAPGAGSEPSSTSTPFSLRRRGKGSPSGRSEAKATRWPRAASPSAISRIEFSAPPTRVVRRKGDCSAKKRRCIAAVPWVRRMAAGRKLRHQSRSRRPCQAGPGPDRGRTHPSSGGFEAGTDTGSNRTVPRL